MNAHSFDSSIYNTFLTNVAHFKDLNSLPVELKFNIDTTTTEDLLIFRTPLSRKKIAKMPNFKNLV